MLAFPSRGLLRALKLQYPSHLLLRAPVVEEGEERVVGGGGGAPAEDLGDELVLLAARVPRVVLQTADVAPARSRQSVALRTIQESVLELM